MLPLARQQCLVRNPANGAAAELSSGEYAVLSTCDGCFTLSEHEARAARELSAPAAHRPAIRQLLERCAREGLLLRLPDLVARFGVASATRPAPIAGISIPTADRPQFVARLLGEASELQRRSEIAHRWHLFDDSRSEEHRRGNREAITSRPELDVTYHDLSVADSFERALSAELPELREEIRALLAAAAPGETSFGRPLNHALLNFAGRRFLSIDDDARIDPRRPALVRTGVDVSLEERATSWYETFDAAFAACPTLPIDPIAEHARWLGLSMASAWQLAERESGGLRTDDLPVIPEQYFDPESRVVFTWNHVLGDPGWRSFSGELLALNTETREWLAANPGASRFAFDTQIRWLGYPSLRLSPQNSLGTATLTGFDNTMLLPPATRTGRGTDPMVGELTRCIHPAAWTVSLPFALPHIRASGRQWTSPSEIPVLEVNRLLIGHVHRRSVSLRARDPGSRLATLGEILVDLAAAGDATLRGLIEEHVADRAGRLTFRVNEQLDDPATPGEWKEVLRKWLASPMLSVDASLLSQQTIPLDSLRAQAREFGRALIAWPRLWAHCRERPQ
jgi:hypothetical protein